MNITIGVEDVTGKMILRQFVGEGSYGDEEFVLAVALPTMSPVVQIGGKTFIVNIHDIVQAVAEVALANREQPEE